MERFCKYFYHVSFKGSSRYPRYPLDPLDLIAKRLAKPHHSTQICTNFTNLVWVFRFGVTVSNLSFLRVVYGTGCLRMKLDVEHPNFWQYPRLCMANFKEKNTQLPVFSSIISWIHLLMNRDYRDWRIDLVELPLWAPSMYPQPRWRPYHPGVALRVDLPKGHPTALLEIPRRGSRIGTSRWSRRGPGKLARGCQESDQSGVSTRVVWKKWLRKLFHPGRHKLWKLMSCTSLASPSRCRHYSH